MISHDKHTKRGYKDIFRDMRFCRICSAPLEESYRYVHCEFCRKCRKRDFIERKQIRKENKELLKKVNKDRWQ